MRGRARLIRNVQLPRVAAEGIEAARTAYQKFAYLWPTNRQSVACPAAGVKLSVSRPSIATYKKRA